MLRQHILKINFLEDLCYFVTVTARIAPFASGSVFDSEQKELATEENSILLSLIIYICVFPL